MNKERKISDELMAQFLCGKITSKEAEEVESYLVDSDEDMEDFINICAATKIMYDEERANEKEMKPKGKRQSICKDSNSREFSTRGNKKFSTRIGSQDREDKLNN